MKKALITGVAGQDGTYLSELLLKKGYQVHGIIHSLEGESYKKNSSYLKDVNIHTFSIEDESKVHNLVREEQYDEVYNLAAMSSVGNSFKHPKQSFNINAISVLAFLDSIRLTSIHTRFYQASSSEIFGGIPEYTPQDEKTKLMPKSPYSVSKLAAHWLVVNYRESYGLKCCSGILFNHESIRRGDGFLTKKVCDWVKSYAKDENDGPLIVGNLNSSRDWGHSKDFVRAMWMMLNKDNLDQPYKEENPTYKEYVVGTGKAFSIRAFIEKALQHVGETVTWETSGEREVQFGENKHVFANEIGISSKGEPIIKIAPEFWRPNEVKKVIANPSLIKEELGWEASISLDEIIKEMIEC
jgi:GDPmannose 4,6-dehydratase